MPTCIVPGCTSGYASNPEKVHFFTIPKDPASVQLWKDAIRRTSDNCVKAGRAVCEKHFRNDEVVWQRKLLSAHGEILGVGQYKVPRLKKGCVPSQFQWSAIAEPLPSKPQNQLSHESINESTFISPVELAPLPSQEENKDSVLDIQVNNVPADENYLTQENSTPTNEASVIAVKQLERFPEIQDPLNDSLRFSELLTAEVHLPLGWIKYPTGCEGKTLISFFINETLKIEDSYHMFPSKNVVVTENMSIQLKVVGLKVNLSDFNVPSCVNDIEELQDLLLKIHRLNRCRGIPESSVNSMMEPNYGILKRDIGNTWRHNACPLLLLNKKVCERCKTARNNLSRMRRRNAQIGAKKGEKKIIGLTEQKRQLTVLQTRYRCALRDKRLAREKVKTLQLEVISLHQQMARYQ